MTQGIETWWLSFCDIEKPEGSQFLGVIIVDAFGFMDAHFKINFLGINPGGEIQGNEITPINHLIRPFYKNRLLSRKECEAFDEEIMKKKQV